VKCICVRWREIYNGRIHAVVHSRSERNIFFLCVFTY
jgi:hypothetical protein